MARGEGVPGNMAGWIANALSEGMSASAALNQLRDEGYGFRRQSWFQLWGEVSAALSQQGVWASADPNTLPSADMFTPWAAGNPGEYAYQVKVQVRATGTGEVGTRDYTFISRDVLTPGEVVDAAMYDYDANTGDAEGEYAETVLGAIPTGGYTMTGQQR